MTRQPKPGWHVLYVRGHHEKKVHEYLQEKDINSYLPLVKFVHQWSDRKKTIYKPLFPSYVFAYITNKIELYKALSTKGVCSYVKFNNKYARLTDAEIKQIKFLTNENDISMIEIKSNIPKNGECRTIVEGVMKGLNCEVIKANNVNKIVVRFESLQQNVIATIPSYFLSREILFQK